MNFTTHDSPVGRLLLIGNSDGLCELVFPDGRRKNRHAAELRQSKVPFRPVCAQLDAYFAGELTEFDLPLQPQGTDFQLDVWRALQDIPYGSTTSYGALAVGIGRPGASRAVGAANGANPLPIIVPCHRVIGANGDLTGFGGGLQTKQWLLAHERGERMLFDLAECSATEQPAPEPAIQ